MTSEMAWSPQRVGLHKSATKTMSTTRSKRSTRSTRGRSSPEAQSTSRAPMLGTKTHLWLHLLLSPLSAHVAHSVRLQSSASTAGPLAGAGGGGADGSSEWRCSYLAGEVWFQLEAPSGFEEVTVRDFAKALAAKLSPPKSADSLRLHFFPPFITSGTPSSTADTSGAPEDFGAHDVPIQRPIAAPNAVPSSSILTLYPVVDEVAGTKLVDQWRALQDAAAAQGQSFTPPTCSFSVMAEAAVGAFKSFKATENIVARELIEQLHDEEPLILEILKGCPRALQFVEEKLKDDPEFVLNAVARDRDGHALQYAAERLRNSRDVVRAAVKQNGLALL
ncbi:unnamed protein product, partial [Amoebophrya sp. A25]|eukprot:GSA25T00006484001.1